MKGTFLIAVVAVVGAAASSKWWLGGKAEAAGPVDEKTSAEVKRGDLRISIDENGYLTAKDNVKIQPKFKGSGTITVLLEEGTEVKPGDVLIEFDKTNLETQISELENSLVQYEIELEASRANLEIQQRDNEATIEKAELTLEIARLNLERYKGGDAPKELRKYTLAVEKAESELERAKELFEQVPELVEQGFLTRIQEEEERIKLREAVINDEDAKLELELHNTYTRHMELTKKETDVRDAERELENARKKADINLKEKQAGVTQRERQVQSTQSRLDEKRAELEHFTIKAENPGILHYGDPDNPWWRDDIQVGATVYQGRTLVTIPDLTTMQVLIQVHEADIDEIDEGQTVLVTVDSRKGETFKGKITEIASVATSTNWTDESNKTFKVEVTLDELEGVELRAGVTAKAEIEVETLENVLYAPIHSIVPESGKHLAFLVTPTGFEEREVKIGRNNPHSVQILEGLEEGERVLLYDPRQEGSVGRGSAAPNGSDSEDSEAVIPEASDGA